ncbi:MAG: energy transducer TonB [Bacteroidales bacterium]|nr:energy transducer TonB [Bacteroidales bacterium]
MKRFLVCFAATVLTCLSLSGQDKDIVIPYIIVEEKPVFKAGDEAMDFSQWVVRNLIYPEEAKQVGAHGRVIVKFTIKPDGEVADVIVQRSSGNAALDAEAVRVVSLSPKWEKPGRQEGHPVSVAYSFPLSFRIPDQQSQPVVKPAAANSDEEAIPFQLVEQKPSFNGGDANEFSKWVNSHLKYPEDAKKNGISGRVVLQFSIMPDGSVANVRVLRSSGNDALDAEAFRVLSGSPKWKPGYQKGSPVKVTYTFPVIFGLR